MNLPPRRVATTPASPLSHKRKERDHFRSFKPPPPRIGSANATKSTTTTTSVLHSNSNSAKQPRLSHDSTPTSKPTTTTQATKPECNNNLLLAGYMAHEFLSNGSIMGEPFDPARAAAVPIKRSSRSIKPSREADDRYAAVASLLKVNGTHVPGIVNPTQLACYLNL